MLSLRSATINIHDAEQPEYRTIIDLRAESCAMSIHKYVKVHVPSHVCMYTRCKYFARRAYELLNSVKSVAIQIGTSGFRKHIDDIRTYDEERKIFSMKNGETDVYG